MKLRGEPKAKRGPRGLKASELLVSPETHDEVGFEWFDPTRQVQLLERIQLDIPDDPDGLINDKNFYQALVELGYFLSVLCAEQSNLSRFKPEQLQGLARKAFIKNPNDEKAWMVGMFDPLIRQKLLLIRPEQLTKTIKSLNELAVFGTGLKTDRLAFAFTMKLVAPQQLRWVTGGVPKDPRDYIEDPDWTAVSSIKAAAMLSVIYPQTRGDLLKGIPPEDQARWKAYMKDVERKATEPGAHVWKRLAWAELMFYQQVLAAESVSFTPEGELKLESPKQQLAGYTKLPERTDV